MFPMESTAKLKVQEDPLVTISRTIIYTKVICTKLDFLTFIDIPTTLGSRLDQVCHPKLEEELHKATPLIRSMAI